MSWVNKSVLACTLSRQLNRLAPHVLMLVMGTALVGCSGPDASETSQPLALPSLTMSHQVGEASRTELMMNDAGQTVAGVAQPRFAQPGFAGQAAPVPKLLHRGPSLTLSQEELDRQYHEARSRLPPPTLSTSAP